MTDLAWVVFGVLLLMQVLLISFLLFAIGDATQGDEDDDY